MARFRPVPSAEKEQLAAATEKIARDIETEERLGALARQPVEDETARIRRLQVELGIVRFEDLPAAQPLLAIERRLRANLQRIVDERDLIHIERHLAGSMGSLGIGAPTGEKAKEFREKRDRLKAKLKVGTVEPPAPKADALPETITRALEVFSDKAVKDRPVPGARLSELDDMEITVSAGLFDVSALIRDLRGDAGYEQAAALRKRHGELSVALFRAAQKFAEAAAEAERSLRAAYTSAGYPPRYDLLPGLQLSAVLVLGNESEYASQLSAYRRFLQDKGLLR